MARKPKDPRELAARALCELHGHPPDIKMDGKPMWMSYLDEVDAVLAAIGFDASTSTGRSSYRSEEKE